MTDIVRKLEEFANSKGYVFEYGRKAVINLIDTGDNFTGLPNTIYFLLEYRKIKPVKNVTKTATKGVAYEGTFYLVKQSDLDQNFFSETGDQATGKYVVNIEPLLQGLTDLDRYFGCTEIEYSTTSADDVTDFLDMNADGLMVNFTAYVPN